MKWKLEGSINRWEDMSNKVDKLFKEKLEEHSLQPSAQAWEKVEAHLGKKNKIVLWTRVAAAIAVMGLLTFVAINWNKCYKQPTKEIVKEQIKNDEGVKEQGEQKVEPAPLAVDKQKEIRKERKAQPKVAAPVAEQPVEQVAIVPIPEMVEETVPQVVQETKKEKGITLTYSLPALKKQEAPAEPVVAEVADPKKKGFERVIEIAKEVKNGDALGELRQAKDDI